MNDEAPPPETKAGMVIPDRPAGPEFPAIQRMKVSLYLDDTEGFGEWAILLSTRAQKDLRDTKRSDGAMFKIVMKKIKYEQPPVSQKLLTPCQTAISGAFFP